MAPRRSRRQPTRSTRNLARKLGRLRVAVKGKVLKLPADPPKFEQIPWNTIVISDTPTLAADAEQKIYTATTIYNVLIAQIGLKTTSQLSFRLQNIQCWNTSGNSINLEVNDMTIGFGSNDFLVQAEDAPGRNRWARLGYVLPQSQQLVSFNSTDTEPLFKVGATKGDTIIIRCRLLWKPRVNTTPNIQARQSSLESRIAHLEQTLMNLTFIPTTSTGATTN